MYKLCDFGKMSTDDMGPQKKKKKKEKCLIYMKEILSNVQITEMLNENGIFNVNEKVNIWTVGCILYYIV